MFLFKFDLETQILIFILFRNSISIVKYLLFQISSSLIIFFVHTKNSEQSV